MKRISITSIVLLLTSTALLNAQLVRGYGVKVGMVSALMKETYKDTDFFGIFGPPELHRRIGASAGVYCEWLNLPVLSLVTQFEYCASGVGHTVRDAGVNGNMLSSHVDYARIDYLTLGIFAKARLSGAVVSPYVLAGPRFDHVIGWNHDGWTNLYDRIDKDITGLTFGGGTEFTRIIPFKILVELRYDIDLSDSYNSQFVTVRKNSFGAWLGAGF